MGDHNMYVQTMTVFPGSILRKVGLLGHHVLRLRHTCYTAHLLIDARRRMTLILELGGAT